MSGKVTLVTGSTSGIGLSIATRLAEAGHTLIINGFGDAKAIHALTADLSSKYNVKVIYSPADMTKPTEITNMIILGLKP